MENATPPKTEPEMEALELIHVVTEPTIMATALTSRRNRPRVTPGATGACVGAAGWGA